jgi:hypothetical protein
MTWFAVDDKLHGHIKSRRARAASMGLWVLAGSYCADNLTDGFVAADVPAILVGKDGPKLAARLVGAKLWHEVEGGWIFHDWSDYQPTAESVRANRAAAKERMTRLRSQGVRANKQRTSAERTPQFALPVPVPLPVPSEGGSSRARATARPRPADEPPGDEPPRLGTVERPNALDAFAMLDAIKRGAGGRFEHRASADLVASFARAVNEAGYSLDELEALGRDLRDHPPAWWKGGRFTVPFLLGRDRDGGNFVALMGDALGRSAGSRPATAAPHVTGAAARIAAQVEAAKAARAAGNVVMLAAARGAAGSAPRE